MLKTAFAADLNKTISKYEMMTAFVLQDRGKIIVLPPEHGQRIHREPPFAWRKFKPGALLLRLDWLGSGPTGRKAIVSGEPRHQLGIEPANDFRSLRVQIKQRRSKPQ